jgi:acetyl esterase
MPLTEGASAALSFIEATGRPFEQVTIDEARAGLQALSAALSAEPTEVGSVQDREIPGAAEAVRVRIYHPSAAGGGDPHPLVLLIHGGGWALGDLETHDRFARSLCSAATAVVVSVDYRRTPQHRFPAALDDTYAALCWAAENADSLGADAARLVVVGDSAGGNLAAAVGLLARDRNGPPIAGQVLIYPVLDARCNTPSYRDFREGYFLTLQKMTWYWQMYLPEGDDGSDPLASPSRADDLSGLPPALVITAGCDPLRDEGEQFASALQRAGVPAITRRYEGLIHAFTLMSRLIPEAQDVVDECASFIRTVPAR